MLGESVTFVAPWGGGYVHDERISRECLDPKDKYLKKKLVLLQAKVGEGGNFQYSRCRSERCTPLF